MDYSRRSAPPVFTWNVRHNHLPSGSQAFRTCSSSRWISRSTNSGSRFSGGVFLSGVIARSPRSVGIVDRTEGINRLSHLCGTSSDETHRRISVSQADWIRRDWMIVLSPSTGNSLILHFAHSRPQFKSEVFIQYSVKWTRWSTSTFKIWRTPLKSKLIERSEVCNACSDLRRRGNLLRIQRGNKHDRIRLTETDLTVRLPLLRERDRDDVQWRVFDRLCWLKARN